MVRTILYYPTISIPNGEWLRQALFYFDEVASIVPQQIYFSGEPSELLVPLTDELEFLRNEDMFRPVAPEDLFLQKGWPVAHQLRDEFEAVVEEKDFHALADARYVRVHLDKLNHSIVSFLSNKGLAKDDAPQDSRYGDEWLLVEEQVALLYMSMLAKYLADIDSQSTVPGTDRREYETQIYHTRVPKNGFHSAEIHLRGIVPAPRSDVKISEILKFKRDREAELMAYRQRISELQQNLAAANEHNELKEELARFQETQRKELNDLVDVLNDARLATVWGSVKTLIKADSPALWGSMGAAVASAAGIASLPISFMIAGAAVMGAIELGSYLVDRRNERRATERNAPFAYLYHAKAEGIL